MTRVSRLLLSSFVLAACGDDGGDGDPALTVEAAHRKERLEQLCELAYECFRPTNPDVTDGCAVPDETWHNVRFSFNEPMMDESDRCVRVLKDELPDEYADAVACELRAIDRAISVLRDEHCPDTVSDIRSAGACFIRIEGAYDRCQDPSGD